HDDPRPMEPFEYVRVRVDMNGIAQCFPAGHRLRLSISTSYWPLAWLPPEPFRLFVTMGSSTLTLPVRKHNTADERLPAFASPEGAEPAPARRLEPGNHNWYLKRDLARNQSMLEVINDQGRF